MKSKDAVIRFIVIGGALLAAYFFLMHASGKRLDTAGEQLKATWVWAPGVAVTALLTWLAG